MFCFCIICSFTSIVFTTFLSAFLLLLAFLCPMVAYRIKKSKRNNAPYKKYRQNSTTILSVYAPNAADARLTPRAQSLSNQTLTVWSCWLVRQPSYDTTSGAFLFCKILFENRLVQKKRRLTTKVSLYSSI